MNKLKAIKSPENVCFNCLKETNVKKIHISALGWGSSFDNFSTRINLCDECLSLTNPKWWELKVCGNHDEYGNYDINGEWYEFEEEIFDFVKQMPLSGQEPFWNTYGFFASCKMKPQDWIDYNLEILPHEKCKEYGLYSFDEIKAYKEKFPTCNYPINVTHNDNSKGCRCIFGVSGEYGQKAGLNIRTGCYECSNYIKRYEPIKIMTYEEFKKYKEYYIGKINYLKYKNKYEKER